MKWIANGNYTYEKYEKGFEKLWGLNRSQAWHFNMNDLKLFQNIILIISPVYVRELPSSKKQQNQLTFQREFVKKFFKKNKIINYSLRTICQLWKERNE